jgi:hypothetical protein
MTEILISGSVSERLLVSMPSADKISEAKAYIENKYHTTLLQGVRIGLPDGTPIEFSLASADHTLVCIVRSGGSNISQEAKGPDKQRPTQESDFVRACFQLLAATNSPTKILYLTNEAARLQFLEGKWGKVAVFLGIKIEPS